MWQTSSPGCEHSEQHPASCISYPPPERKAFVPQQISQEFRTFYSSLYNLSDTPPTDVTLTEYLDQSLVPTLPPETQELLEEPTAYNSIGPEKSAKPGKAPSPDGLTLQDPSPFPWSTLGYPIQQSWLREIFPQHHIAGTNLGHSKRGQRPGPMRELPSNLPPKHGPQNLYQNLGHQTTTPRSSWLCPNQGG